jgi:hypothetical protein
MMLIESAAVLKWSARLRSENERAAVSPRGARRAEHIHRSRGQHLPCLVDAGSARTSSVEVQARLSPDRWTAIHPGLAWALYRATRGSSADSLCLLGAQPTLVNVCASTVLRPMQVSGLTALKLSLLPVGLIW